MLIRKSWKCSDRCKREKIVNNKSQWNVDRKVFEPLSVERLLCPYACSVKSMILNVTDKHIKHDYAKHEALRSLGFQLFLIGKGTLVCCCRLR